MLLLLLGALALILGGCGGAPEEPEEPTEFKFVDFGDGTIGIDGVNWEVCTTTDLVIPATTPSGQAVTTILASAFEGDTKITSITLPEGLESIQDKAFKDCTSLTKVVIPDSVYMIRDSAFFGCTALAEMDLPASLTDLGDNAFWGCASLTSLEIPADLVSLGGSAFASCSGLTEIKVAEGNAVFKVVDNCLIQGSGVVLGCKTSVIPTDGSIDYIANYAFSGADLIRIVIPEGIEDIGSGAFSGCTKAESISLPHSLTRIGYAAFYGCTGVSEVHIAELVTSIGGVAFGNCENLTDVYYENTQTAWEYAQNQGGYPFENVTCTVHCTNGTIAITP